MKFDDDTDLNTFKNHEIQKMKRLKYKKLIKSFIIKNMISKKMMTYKTFMKKSNIYIKLHFIEMI